MSSLFFPFWFPGSQLVNIISVSWHKIPSFLFGFLLCKSVSFICVVTEYSLSLLFSASPLVSFICVVTVLPLPLVFCIAIGQFYRCFVRIPLSLILREMSARFKPLVQQHSIEMPTVGLCILQRWSKLLQWPDDPMLDSPTRNRHKQRYLRKATLIL